jgi:hypothetical protein
MKTLATILISTLILSSPVLASIPKYTISAQREIKSIKQIKQYSEFPDNYSSLSQIPDNEIQRRKIILKEDRLPITYPKGTIDLFR